MSQEKIVGMYADPAEIAADPAYLDRVQQELGLNRIILGGGVNLSTQVRQLNPIVDGPPDVAPGVTLTEDDTPLRQAIAEAHKRGIQVWGITSAYWAGAEHAPYLMARDLTGRRMDEFPRYPFSTEQGSMTFCPNNERVNDWFEAALVDIATRYDIQGYALTHFRYCHPAFFEQMLACGCSDCQKKATETGYDFAAMKNAVLGLIETLKATPADTLRSAAVSNLGFFDFIQLLGGDAQGVIDWFDFRADTFTRNLERFYTAVHEAAEDDFAFGSDVHYPSMALLVGHRYRDFARICDHILPLLAHNEIHYLTNLGSFASLLVQWVPGLEEAEAVALVYRLFGVHTPAMPATITDMYLGNAPDAEAHLGPLEELVASEMYKARLLSGERVPSYPVIKGTLWPAATIRRLMETALAAHHDGIILQGTDSLFSYPQ